MYLHRVFLLIVLIATSLTAMEGESSSCVSKEWVLAYCRFLEKTTCDKHPVELERADISALFTLYQEEKDPCCEDKQKERLLTIASQSKDSALKSIALRELENSFPSKKPIYEHALTVHIAQLIDQQFDNDNVTLKIHNGQTLLKLNFTYLKNALSFPLLQILDRESTNRIINDLCNKLLDHDEAVRCKKPREAEEIRIKAMDAMACCLMSVPDPKGLRNLLAFRCLHNLVTTSPLHLELLCRSAFNIYCFYSNDFGDLATTCIEHWFNYLTIHIKEIQNFINQGMPHLSALEKVHERLADFARSQQECCDMMAYIGEKYDTTTIPLLLLTHPHYLRLFTPTSTVADVGQNLTKEIIKRMKDLSSKEKIIHAFKKKLTAYQTSDSAPTLEGSIAALKKLLPIKEKLRGFERERTLLDKEVINMQLVSFGLDCFMNRDRQLGILDQLRQMFSENAKTHEGAYAMFEFICYARRNPTLALSYDNELELLESCSMPFYKSFARGIK